MSHGQERPLRAAFRSLFDRGPLPAAPLLALAAAAFGTARAPFTAAARASMTFRMG